MYATIASTSSPDNDVKQRLMAEKWSKFQKDLVAAYAVF
jgi:hypothetical protein